MRDPRRVGVLISGRGSNMQALVDRAHNYEVVLVASNKPQAPGLDWARVKGLPTWAWDSKGVDKEEFDRALSAALEDHRIGTIALAGFMRILSPWFIEQWEGRIRQYPPVPTAQVSRTRYARPGNRGGRRNGRLLGSRRHRRTRCG